MKSNLNLLSHIYQVDYYKQNLEIWALAKFRIISHSLMDSPLFWRIFSRFKDTFEDDFSVTWIGINGKFKCQNKITRKKNISRGLLQVLVFTAQFQRYKQNTCASPSILNEEQKSRSWFGWYVLSLSDYSYVSSILGETSKTSFFLFCFVFLSLFEWLPNTSFLQADISPDRKECVWLKLLLILVTYICCFRWKWLNLLM